MVFVGVVIIIIGIVGKIVILWTIGIIAVVVGVTCATRDDQIRDRRAQTLVLTRSRASGRDHGRVAVRVGPPRQPWDRAWFRAVEPGPQVAEGAGAEPGDVHLGDAELLADLRRVSPSPKSMIRICCSRGGSSPQCEETASMPSMWSSRESPPRGSRPG